MDHGDDFVIADTLPELVDGMNALIGDDLLGRSAVESIIRARDNEMTNPYSKDAEADSTPLCHPPAESPPLQARERWRFGRWIAERAGIGRSRRSLRAPPPSSGPVVWGLSLIHI